MNIAGYREAVLLGFRSIIGAAMKWRGNPLTREVNRRMWGPVPWVGLGLLVVAVVPVSAIWPSLDYLAGLAPPLVFLGFLPDTICDLVWSAPAAFGLIVALRVRRLRAQSPEDWPDRRCRSDFGVRFFEAGALPVVVAGMLVAVGVEAVGGVWTAFDGPADTLGVGDETSAWQMSFSSIGFARNLMVVALVAGLASVHRAAGQAFGKLMGAGFTVWGIHIGIAFAAPWLVSWVAYVPVVGAYVPEPSVDGVHMIFDLAVAVVAWTAAREKSRAAPFWSDVPPPPLPAVDAEGE